MSSAQSPQGMTRRELFRRGGAAAAGTAAVVGGGSQIVPQFSPIGRAQAIAPIVVVGGVAAASAGVGWALGEWDPLKSDTPPDGLTGEALKNEVYTTSRTRKSTNASTIVDNENILDGVKHAAYADGKVAAIEALNDQKSQSNVSDAGTAAVDSYETTVKKNLIKTWNEAARELESAVNSLSSHADTSPSDVYTPHYENGSTEPATQASVQTVAHTLPDGSTIDVVIITISDTFNHFAPFDTGHGDSYGYDGGADPFLRVSYDGDSFDYLRFTDWRAIWTEITSVFDSVSNGIVTWVDNIYGKVQAGELDTADLLTPRELAEMSASEEGVNQAIADLVALNIPVNLEREAKIEISRPNETVTVSGMLAPTDPPSDGMTAGTTYDPSNMTGDVYFTYDVTQGTTTWTAYQTGVDGGVVTFTAEPHSNLSYKITTTAGETVTVPASDFTYNDGGTPDDTSDDTWTVDISSEVETAITEVDTVEMVSSQSETQYETIQLKDPFTIKKFTDSDGNEYDSATFTNNEPQDDTNYITQDEWDNLQERNEELIQKYEDANNDGGGPLFAGFSGGGGLAGLGAVAVVVAAIAAVVRR